jgi:DNA-binding response OmpR family regulator
LTRIAVLADDLIWATRLTDLVRAAGAEPVPARTLAHLQASLLEVDGVVVDLTARAYDGIEAVKVARTARRSVLAVGQHDDVAQRQEALEAGAVFAPYRRLADGRSKLMDQWLLGSVLAAAFQA